MPKKIRISDLPEFDMTEHLRDEEDVAAYLTMVLEEGDPDELSHALGILAPPGDDRDFPKKRNHPGGPVSGASPRSFPALRHRV